MADRITALTGGYPCRHCGRTIEGGDPIVRVRIGRFLHEDCHDDAADAAPSASSVPPTPEPGERWRCGRTDQHPSHGFAGRTCPGHPAPSGSEPVDPAQPGPLDAVVRRLWDEIGLSGWLDRSAWVANLPRPQRFALHDSLALTDPARPRGSPMTVDPTPPTDEGTTQRPGGCACKSHNHEVGTVPEVVLPSPPWAETEHPNGVCVDACIADVVAGLWAAGIVTVGSCCGHNGATSGPSIILGEHEHTDRATSVLAALDPRPIELLQWRLVPAPPAASRTPEPGDDELPGMWERADFEGGLDEVRPSLAARSTPLPTERPECERCDGSGCDLNMCEDCGEEFTDPCARHRSFGHVASPGGGYTDGVDCSTCCTDCHPAPLPTEQADGEA